MKNKKVTFGLGIVYLVLLFILFCTTATQAADFQLVVAVALAGGQPDPVNWQDVLRYRIADTGGAATQLSSIPNGQVFDPAGVAFRSSDELYIGNRHGDILGQGSISRFRLDPTGGYTYLGNFTTTGMTAVHEMSFSPTSGELFAMSLATSNTFRFRFNGDDPQPNGYFSAGAEGILVSPLGNKIFETDYSSNLRQFQINPDGTITTLASIAVPGAHELHMMGMRPGGEMYIADFYGNCVFRYKFSPEGDLIYSGFVSAYRALDAAFSPDGQEMFVSYANGDLPTGGIHRYLYQPSTDSWQQSGVIYTPRPAGIGITPMPIPEPCTLSLLALGGLTLLRKRRR